MRNLIISTWNDNPKDRPTFSEILEFFSTSIVTAPTSKAYSFLKSVATENRALTAAASGQGSQKIPSEKQVFSTPKRFSVSRRVFIASLAFSLVVLIVAGVVVYILVNPSKAVDLPSSLPTITTSVPTTTAVSTSTTTTKTTIKRTASPTATMNVFTIDSRLKSVYGITIDEDDNFYVAVPVPSSVNVTGYPLIYKITYQTATVVSLIANLSGDNQGMDSITQGICYFNKALYVPRMGLLTKIDLANNNAVTPFGGTGTVGIVKDGPKDQAVFNGATNCIADKAGNIYVAEIKFAIRMVPQIGDVSTLLTAAARPIGLTFDADGYLIYSTNIFLLTGNVAGKIYRKDPTLNSADATLIAGSGYYNAATNEAPALQIAVPLTTGMAYDELGNLYLSFPRTNAIWKLNATTNFVSKFAGGGSGIAVGFSSLSSPQQIVIDSKGVMFVADQGANTIRRINW
jgi:hypothetical protein